MFVYWVIDQSQGHCTLMVVSARALGLEPIWSRSPVGASLGARLRLCYDGLNYRIMSFFFGTGMIS